MRALRSASGLCSLVFGCAVSTDDGRAPASRGADTGALVLDYAEALLEDADGNPRTTPVSIDDFRSFGNDALSVSVDFAARSFY